MTRGHTLYMRMTSLAILALCTLTATGADTIQLRNQTRLSKKNLRKGYDLFFNSSPCMENGKSCAQCHTVNRTDSFNWNPTLHEIGNRIRSMSYDEFRELLTDPFGSDLLMESHISFMYLADTVPKGSFVTVSAESYRFCFTEEELQSLFDYIRVTAAMPQPKTRQKFNFRAWGVVFFAFLIFLAAFDLLISKKIRLRRYHWLIITISLTAVYLLIRRDLLLLGLQAGYSPDQPIRFSHRQHCRDNEINCLYCHPAAKHAMSAGFPSRGLCMNCHLIIREGSKAGEFELRKLTLAAASNKPIRWKRVNSLPAHVGFSHRQHAGIGHIDCLKCHVQLDESDRVKQIVPLSMNWCLDCHQQKYVIPGQNAYYRETYASLTGLRQPHGSDSISVKDLGGWDCMNCHR